MLDLDVDKRVDFTILKPIITAEEFDNFLNIAEYRKYRSICTFPKVVKENMSRLKKTMELGIKICVVMDFPFGQGFIADKVLSMADMDVVDEFDIVPDLSLIGTGRFADHLQILRDAYHNDVIKIIIETEILTHEQIIDACAACNAADVDFIKTCTGKNGKLTDEKLDIVLANRGHCKVKASGGVKTLARAQEMIMKGVDVIGTSAILTSMPKD